MSGGREGAKPKDFTLKWNLRNKQNPQMEERTKSSIRLVNTENRLVAAREEEGGGGGTVGEGGREIQASSYGMTKSQE